MFGCYSHWVYISTVLLLVNANYAQVRVEVIFDPPSPVKQGNVTFKCDFTLPAGTILAQQYWQIVNGDRFFEYVPGGNLSIHVDYTDKILSYDTDNTTFLEIVFNVTACDVEQYLCNILANSSADNSRQESLEVENMIEPTLKYGSIEIADDTTCNLTAAVNVSCTLNDAGPPLPELLEIEVTGGSLNSTSSEDHEQLDETCTWIYNTPVVIEVTDLDGVEEMTFRCRVNYTDRDTKLSPTLTLQPLCLDFDCNNGTCMVGEGAAKCDCPTNIFGDRCNDTSCENNECWGPSTCDPEDDFDLNYSCNCTGYNLYGPFCNETGCNSRAESGCYCRNDGNCTDTLWNCSCICPAGCSGPHCANFDEGDLCPLCGNNIPPCIQTCDSFNCECDYNFNSTFCNQSCDLVTDNSFKPGTYNVTLGDPSALYCDSDEANSIIWVDENDNFVQNGSNLTIGVSYMANETSYFCRLMGPDCNQQIEYFLDVIPIPIEATEDTTESGNLDLTLAIDDIGPFIASIKQDSGPALSGPVITLCWRLDNENLNCSTSGTAEYFEPRSNVTEEDEGNYTAVAQYLDYTQVLTTIYVDIGNYVEPGSPGLSGGEIAGIVIGTVLLAGIIVAALLFVYIKRDRILRRGKDTEPSGEPGQKKGRDSHEMRDEDNKIHVNDSSQKENSYSESPKSKIRRSKVRQDPQWPVNQRNPNGGERLPPIGKSEPEQTETSPKRKKKRRRRRKAPDGEPDTSPGPEDRPRPLPMPSSSPSRRLPPIERIELERNPVYNGYESTPL